MSAGQAPIHCATGKGLGNRLFLAVVLLVLGSVVHAQTMDGPASLEQSTLYQVDVAGLKCEFCAYNVERRLQALDGVEYVDVDLAASRVLVGTGQGKTLDRAQVATLLKDAGFEFKGLRTQPLTRESLAGE